MSDLQNLISQLKNDDPEFAQEFDKGSPDFKVNALLKQAREEAGLTQNEMAQRLSTQKSAISRIENHATDIKLSTLASFAQALGKRLEVRLV